MNNIFLSKQIKLIDPRDVLFFLLDVDIVYPSNRDSSLSNLRTGSYKNVLFISEHISSNV